MILFLLFITFNVFAVIDTFDPLEQINHENLCFQEDQSFKNCPDHVKMRHRQAMKILDEASAWVLSPIEELRKDIDVTKSFQDYFKIDLKNIRDENKVKAVVAQVVRLKNSVRSIQYSCKSEKKGLWCASDPYAIVPPPKTSIVLCPSYFELAPKYQLGVLLHEWNHFAGSNHIDYLPENYCDTASEISSDKLVRSSDMYMLFLYSLATAI